MTNQAKIVVTAEDRASEVLRGLRGNVDAATALFSRFSGVLGGLGIAAAGAGLVRLVGQLDDLKDAAQGLGVSASQLDAFRNAAAAGGVESEGLDTALRQLNLRIAETADGGGKSAEIFRRLGIAVRDANGDVRPTAVILAEVADRFASYRDGAEKSALATELLGKSGAKLIPVLNEGAEGLTKFGGASQQAIDEAAKLQGEVDKLTAAFGRLTKSAAGGAASIINKAIGLSNFNTQAVEERSRIVRETIAGLERELAGIPTADIGTRRKFLEAELRRLRAVLEGIRDEASEQQKQAPGRAPELPLQQPIETATKAADDLLGKLREIQREYRANVDVLRDRQRIESDIERLLSQQQQRLDDLTGRSVIEQQTRDLQLLEDALFDARISLQEFDVAYAKLFGTSGEVSKGIEKTREEAEQLALVLSSSLGGFIERGGSARDFFDALTKDVLKLTTQLLILRPLTEGLTEIFGGTAAKSSGGKQIAGLGSLIGSLFSGFFADGGFIPPGRFGIVGEQGPEVAYGGRSGKTISPMGGPSVVINMNAPVPRSESRVTANQIAAAVARKLKDADRRFD